MLSKNKFFSLSFFLINLIYFFVFSFSFAQSVSCPSLSYFQTVGSRDTVNRGETTLLQKFLKDYFNLSDQQFIVSGYFGNITKKYVSDFQARNNLPTTGVVSVSTRKKILEICKQPKYVPQNIIETNTPPLNIYGALPTPGKPVINIFMSTSTPLNVTFNLQNLTAKKYVIDFGDRTNTVLYNNGLELSTAHEYKNYGNFKVTLYERYDCDYRRPLSCLVGSSRSVGSVQVKLVAPVEDIGLEPEENAYDDVPVHTGTLPHTLLLSGENFFSPEIFKSDTTNTILFSGKLKENTEGVNIYKANCDKGYTKCREIEIFFDTQESKFNYFADPSIVYVGASASTPAKWLMYLTARKNNEENFGIYYSELPVSGNSSWSSPVLVMENYRKPTLTKRENGAVELFAYGATSDQPYLAKFVVSPDGKKTYFVGNVSVYGSDGKLTKANDAYVRYNPSSKKYQILAEQNNDLNYYTSLDGFTWNFVRIAIERKNSSSESETIITMPTVDPDDFTRIIFSSSEYSEKNFFQIKTTVWR